ncbi:MAG: prepilin peptidase, partial [Candidatus Roizmanbacteria bacterium]|nr:prepilin peptidase [Candidatus Roizmanbacteria bacterium]
MGLFSNLVIFIFGASIGSFLNVLIDRLPKNESINGRSHCDYCGKKIAWYDLIPVFSFFILRGKTRCCHKKLSFQYPIVETITGLAFVWLFKDSPYIDSLTRTVLTVSILSALIVIFISDLKYHLISDYILLALFIFSLMLKIVIPAQAEIQAIEMSILSGLVVAFPIWLIYFISKERAMGLGDVYLSAVMGFLLGWKEGLLALYIAFITGA